MSEGVEAEGEPVEWVAQEAEADGGAGWGLKQNVRRPKLNETGSKQNERGPK
jgi:hypothetical protein